MMKHEIANLYYAAVGYAAAALCYGYDAVWRHARVLFVYLCNTIVNADYY